ncbi:MAG TPA: hypothetical protein VN723_02865 [Rhizomicrobium sp.]|jgi:hypothetical protein|nr:hypothetical protein [Rhizomicrobium sp.]
MREPATANFALIAALLGFAAAAFAPQIFHDGDTWWHLAAGKWILAHQAVPARDIFTYSFAGQPWSAHEWLAEVLMALACLAADWSGLHLLFGLAFGATAWVLAQALRRRLDFIPALLVTVMGLACVSGSLLARPHLLALPLLALWTASLVEARERNRAPPLWLALVMLAWANLHGGFAFGLALAAALALEAVFANGDKIETARRWGRFLGASTLAAIVTPQGLDGLLFPFRLLLMPGLGRVGEWAPTDLIQPSPFLVTVLAMLFVLATGKLRLTMPRALLILVLTYLGLSHVRHVMLFGIAAPLLAAPAMATAWPAEPQSTKPQLGRIGIVGAALTGLLLLVRLMFPAERGEDRVSPVAALAAVPKSVQREPVLNAYDYGGYLIFNSVKVFIDGRTDMYPTDFLKQDDRINEGDSATIAATLAAHHVSWTIFPAASPTVETLDHLPGWHRLHADANAVVHVKDQPPPPG